MKDESAHLSLNKFNLDDTESVINQIPIAKFK